MALTKFFKISDKQHWRRIVSLILLCAIVFIITRSDSLFLGLEKLLAVTESSIIQHPRAGKFLFVLFSMLSAMLAFFSSAILVPIGVNAWGAGICFVLLWTGWFLGGLCAYAIGYFAGSSVVAMFVGEERLDGFKKQLKLRARFIHVLLFQSALPSEFPGYVLGTVKFRLDYYLAALALTEIPYAIGTVYLGESFLQRDMSVFIVILMAGITFAIAAYRLYRRQLSKN